MSKKIKWVIIALAAICLIVAGAYCIVKLNKKEPIYSDYTVVNTSERADSKGAEYAKFGEGYLRYSKDGIAYYSADNMPIWNSSYELSQPLLDIRDDYCAIAGIGSSRIYVFNTTGQIAMVDTVLSIVTISVSSRGYVTAVVEDNSTQYIDMYDTLGEKVYHIKTSIKGNGLPTDISISNDGSKLMVAYATLDGGVVNTSIAFYNFGEVGKNEAERLVGGFDQYQGMLVPMVSFVDNQTSIAFATDKMSIYTISQYPKLVADVVLEEPVHSLFYSDDYIGLIFTGHSVNAAYVLKVYDLKGNLLLTQPLTKNYKEYAFVGTNILMYDDFEVHLVDFKGTQRFNKTFDTAIDSLIPVAGDDTYVYISTRKVQKIKLVE